MLGANDMDKKEPPDGGGLPLFETVPAESPAPGSASPPPAVGTPVPPAEPAGTPKRGGAAGLPPAPRQRPAGPATPGFGSYLRQLRQLNQLSIGDLAEATRIRSTYLEAIEAEEYGDLPPAVYVLAYVKMLCRFYQLDDETVETLTSDIRQHLEYEAPGDPSKSVVDLEISEENPILLKRILLIGAGGVLLAVALITFVTLLLTSEPAPASVPAGAAPARLDESRLIELQTSPELESSELPVTPR